MRLTFLGTGTSTGIPLIGCQCKVCTSTDSRDQRLRCSALVEFSADETADYQPAKILIDCGPDFRQQALRHHITHLDAILLTHEHYDHVGGLDDVRALAQVIDIYADNRTSKAIHRVMPYCFGSNHYPGSPHLELHLLTDNQTFSVRGIEINSLPIIHHDNILGYRIGPLGYITDCKHMPQQTIEALKGVDTLVLNALRIEPHPTHICLNEALQLAQTINARQTYFTHFSHDLGLHAAIGSTMPESIHLAYDGLTLDI